MRLTLRDDLILAGVTVVYRGRQMEVADMVVDTMPDVPLAVAISVYGREPRLMEIMNRTQPPTWDVGTAEDRQRIVRHRLIRQVDEGQVQQVIAVCESLLDRRTPRQSDVRAYKGRLEREFRQALEAMYGHWMRLSRTNELGVDPEYVVRKVGCALSAETIQAAVGRENDVEVIKSGLQKLLRYSGARAAKGSQAAGQTIGQLRRELRSRPGLPILFEGGELTQALQSMAQDSHPDTGIVVMVGKAFYGYDDRRLPTPLSDDWLVWLKAYAPEPPAPQDVKHAVRQTLANASRLGVAARQVQADVRRDLDVPERDVLRALAELVNEGEAMLEQKEARFPADGDLTSDRIADTAQIWLVNYAPPDDRQARRRIMELVRDAGTTGMTLSDLRNHLAAEGVEAGAVHRGLERLLQGRAALAYIAGKEAAPALIHDPSLLTERSMTRCWNKPMPKAKAMCYLSSTSTHA